MKKTFLSLIFLLLCGCGVLPENTEPSIEFSVIPQAETGGTMRLASIEGSVKGARPGQQIVLYTRSGNWYVQPFTDQPFTKIEANSKWQNSTHLGTEYAALLVEPGYVPPNETSVLPNKGGAISAITIVKGTPEFWQSRWFRLGLLAAGIFLLVAYFRFRMLRLTRELNVRFEERLAERTRIAHELHDSLLQGFVGVSMQVSVAAEQVPGDSPAKPQLERALKMIEKVVEEGRHTVQGLRSSKTDDYADLEQRFSELRSELDANGKTAFRIIVTGKPKPLCPAVGDDVYHICREALINAFRHSQAGKIEVEIEYAAHDFRIVVRDDGVGIDPQIVATGREKHFGLSGMKERAEKVGARLKVSSRPDAGTEIELSVPNSVVFETGNPARPFKWLTGLSSRRSSSGKEKGK